jgi:serine/threonine-protein kinase
MLQVGTRTGDYEICDVVQTSKKEIVYKVRNLAVHRMESMKVLPESLRHDPEALERFLREIKVHARLQHPNIVAFYQATQLDGVPVLTTEFVEGVTLAGKLAAGSIPFGIALSYMTQLLSALSHAHSLNIIHREITPESILITPEGGVKLAGFGLAKAQGDISLTQVGAAVGAVAYMSPEQVKGRGGIDFRTDIYSAGIVLYEMLAGRRPFNATSDFEMMLAHVERKPPAVTSINRAMPPALDAAVARALAKKPEDRFPSAEAFAAALRVERRAAPRAPRVQSPITPEPPPQPVIPPFKPATVPVSGAAHRESWLSGALVPGIAGLTLVILLLWSLRMLFR